MADVKISQLPQLLNSGLHGGDTLPIVDSVAGQTKQISIAQLDLRWQALPAGGTTNQILRKLSSSPGDVGWATLTKADVGLGNVNNTSDLDKPISTAVQAALNLKANTSALAAKADISYVNAQLSTKQDSLGTGTEDYVLTWKSGAPSWEPGGGGGGAVSSVFGRTGAVVALPGDYSKADVGLDQVDNTSDMDKPVSTATLAALNGKQDSLPAGTNGYFLSLSGGNPTWAALPNDLPSGGTTGQALVKNSATNYDVSWQDIRPGLVVSNTQTLTGGGTITLQTVSRQRVKIQGTSGEALVLMPNGTIDGQEVFVEGVSDSNPCVIEASGNVAANGDLYCSALTLFCLVWDDGLSTWMKVG